LPHDEDFEYGYKVDLEQFSGPLDLLLYLIRQEEVDITNIPVARITEQYLAHLDVLQAINVNLAGEFLVMAATLMEVKSRMLLPRPELDEEEEEDPRTDLIRQLMEYKRFKDAARQLSGRADRQALKFLRGAGSALGLPERPPEEDLPILLGEVTVWDLVAAFKVILSQTTLLDASRHIVLDDKPIAAYCNDLLDTLRGHTTSTFRQLFEPDADRSKVISTFLALLELIRRRRLRAEQGDHHGDIRIVLLDDTPVSMDEPPVPQPTADTQPPADPTAAAPAVAAQPPELDDEVPTPDSEVDDIVVPEVEPLPPADQPTRRPSHRRPVKPPLVNRAKLEEEFDVDSIQVPELRTEPPPMPKPESPIVPPPSLCPPPTCPRKAPTLLALLTGRGAPARASRPRILAPLRPTRRR